MSAFDTALIRALRSATVHLPAGEIASLLHSTREAVTAGVAGLREAGFDIDERPGLGFRLLASPDRLIADDLRARLGSSRLIRDIIVFEETDSTNERAAQLGRGGALGGVAIFAEQQTAGRGRFGRRWESAMGLGLWFSLLLRPTLPLAHWPRLTTWTAVALAHAIESLLPVRCEIKWPNDVQLGGRKVAGVLIETGIDPAGEAFAVVGIGLNVNHEAEHFPDELRDRATSLRLAARREVNRPALAVELLRALESWHGNLERDFSAIVAEATNRGTLLGRRIAVCAGTVTTEGTAEALDADGQLLLRTSDGILHTIGAGEATVVSGPPGTHPAE
jgi:BirA family biotin operon repressor/biotin-[acetyl-CoA-carboxylase] ligase